MQTIEQAEDAVTLDRNGRVTGPLFAVVVVTRVTSTAYDILFNIAPSVMSLDSVRLDEIGDASGGLRPITSLIDGAPSPALAVDGSNAKLLHVTGVNARSDSSHKVRAVVYGTGLGAVLALVGGHYLPLGQGGDYYQEI